MLPHSYLSHEIMGMGDKEILVLFLINGNPGIRTIYGLIRHFDRAKFPAEMGKSIDQLISHDLIKVTGYFDNNTPSEYGITENGKDYLRREFNKEQILKYIGTFDRPELTIAYVQNNEELK